MSIKPEFYNKIIKGEKKIEYRKIAPKNFDKIILYVSSPVKKILGHIDVLKISTNNPDIIWEETKELGGITKDYFYKYVGKKLVISAIYIKKITIYNKPLYLKNFKAPQNYLFRTDEELSYLEKKK